MEDDTIKMFGPLNFKDSSPGAQSSNAETPCLLCNDAFNLDLCFTVFLKHCFGVHRLVIEDVQNIHNLHEYILYWKEKLAKTPMESIIPSVAVDSADNKFFLISTLMTEDKLLRHRLKLNDILKQQEFERTDESFEHMCLFCKFQFQGVRSDYVKHLSDEHNLQLGNSQNLVFVDELIGEIENKLDNLQCIFCEKTFPDRKVLKEHMRKKIHKRINPQNRNYDKYYIVNYLEPDKSWEAIEKEEEVIYLGEENNSDDEYADWKEKEDQITCLFCSHKENSVIDLCNHMVDSHVFDFKATTGSLDFYQKLKLVNFVRRQMHSFHCVYCDEVCEDHDSLRNHMVAEEHCKIPSVTSFDQPEYYFPTYENDAFLYLIDDIED